MSTAWITAAGGLLLYAKVGSNISNPFDSAIARLICGVSAEFGDERYRFLRQRIFINAPISEWEKHLVKVCAKRVTPNVCFESVQFPKHKMIDLGRTLSVDPKAVRLAHLIGESFSHKKAMALVTNLARTEHALYKDYKPHLSPRPVAVAMLNDDGILLGVAVNTNTTVQMRHAEANLIVNLMANEGFAVPHGARIYTSLKPCRMCASLILHAFKNHPETTKSFRVFSASDDPGPFGRHELLGDALSIDSGNQII